MRCIAREIWRGRERVRKRRHGFLQRVRNRTPGGVNVIKRRKAKGRTRLAA